MDTLWSRLSVPFVCGLSLLSLTTATSYPSVTIDGCTLRGIYTQSRGKQITSTFLGVRFAKPPVDDLRFENAQPADPCEGEVVADTMPPACMQMSSFNAVGPISEDCLFMCIYSPNMHASPPLPVMVWFFGGGFEHGTISSYTPEYLMEGNVVLVTIQYRIGLFGFLSTGDSVMPGNQGIKDQRLGLRWVQKHIGQFGGDPSKVTIFGQSSGAVSVHAHLLYTSHEGLFRAGISQSGTALMGFAFHPPSEVKDVVSSVAMFAKCPTASKAFVACMKKKSAKELIDVFQKYQLSTSVGSLTKGFFPLPGLVLEPECVKDRIVTASPWTVKVTLPWIVGSNDREGLSIMSPIVADRSETTFKLLSNVYNKVLSEALNCKYSSVDGTKIGPATRKFYLKDQPVNRKVFPELCDVQTDAFFTYGTFESIKRADPTKTYVYYVTYRGKNYIFPVELKDAEIIGASHGSETFLLFPHPFNVTDTHIHCDADEKKSQEVVKLWTNFAYYMNPTPSEADMGYTWPPFGSEETFLEIGTMSSKKTKFLTERMRFWQSIGYPVRDDTYEPVPCNR